MLASCVGYATADRRDSGAFRIPIAVQFLWAIILSVGLCLLPESPRYWVKKGHFEKALAALARVRGQPVTSELVEDELSTFSPASPACAIIIRTATHVPR
jgi:hypothetical protein